jgi:hypothetical protein
MSIKSIGNYLRTSLAKSSREPIVHGGGAEGLKSFNSLNIKASSGYKTYNPYASTMRGGVETGGRGAPVKQHINSFVNRQTNQINDLEAYVAGGGAGSAKLAASGGEKQRAVESGRGTHSSMAMNALPRIKINS